MISQPMKGQQPSANSHELAPGGWLLVAFHVDSPEFAAGEINHLSEWFVHRIELDGYFLSPDEVADALAEAGFTIMAKIVRQPISAVEYPSRRCYILAQRNV